VAPLLQREGLNAERLEEGDGALHIDDCTSMPGTGIGMPRAHWIATCAGFLRTGDWIDLPFPGSR